MVGGRPALRAGIQPRLRDPACLPPTVEPLPRHRPHSADDRLIGRLLDPVPRTPWAGRLLRLPPTRTTGSCPGSGRTTCRPQPTLPATRSNAIPATSHCGRPPAGERRGNRREPGPAGLAPGVLGDGCKLPGEQFDIHGGGIDLDLPCTTRTNWPQSKALGTRLRGTWLHNSWVTAAGEKMGKSLGNALVRGRGAQTRASGRVALPPGGPHHRSTLEFSYDPSPSRVGSDSAASRLFCRDWLANRPAALASECPDPSWPRWMMIWEFLAAVASSPDTVRVGNGAIEAGDDRPRDGRGGR